MLLSVCILMKGDAENLRRLAAMVKPLADELIVVCDDPASQAFQKTAAECQARLVPFQWQNDFAAARNAGLEAARGNWVFWVDSDETLLMPDAQTFRKLLERTDVLGYMVTIEDLVEGADMLPRQHLSLYRRYPEIRYTGRVHEHFEPSLETHAARRHMTIETPPVRLQHTGYQPQYRPEKLRRNIRLLELELADRPGQIYYLIELGRSLLLSGQTKGHAVLADAAKLLRPLLSQRCPPSSLAAALLEYALSHAPADFPISPAMACETAERWFPGSPPLKWHAARWHFGRGEYGQSAELLRDILEMGESGHFNTTISFDLRIFGDETRLNLGVCLAKLGHIEEALKHLALIKNGSPFFEMAKTNIDKLIGHIP